MNEKPNGESVLRAMVEDKDYAEYVLAELRLALKRAKLYTNEINRIGIALKSGAIHPDQAVAWMHEAGAGGFLQPTAPVANGHDDSVEFDGCTTEAPSST